MINLLPEQNKLEIRKEYKLRIIVVILVFCFIATLILSILLVPSYLLIVFRARHAEEAITSITNPLVVAERADLIKQIQGVTANMVMLQPGPAHQVPTDIIALIIKDKTPDNILTGFNYTENPSGPFKIVVTGTAKTRESLLAFVTSLRNEKSLAPVDLPVSSFAQDTSINFSLTINGSK